jgi:hypothetical protein
MIASLLAVALLLGPVQPLVFAQQAPPAAPAQVAPAAPQPPAAEDIRYQSRPRGVDGYDVGAGALTVLKAPFNVGLCALGSVVGATLFVITLGSAYKATTQAVAEGCRGPWLIRGDDIRPEARAHRAEWMEGTDGR